MRVAHNGWLTRSSLSLSLSLTVSVAAKLPSVKSDLEQALDRVSSLDALEVIGMLVCNAAELPKEDMVMILCCRMRSPGALRPHANPRACVSCASLPA